MSLLGYGRSIIYTNYDEINDGNVVEVLKESYKEHLNNRTDIVKLWEYYRGKTDILMNAKSVWDWSAAAPVALSVPSTA